MFGDADALLFGDADALLAMMLKEALRCLASPGCFSRKPNNLGLGVNPHQGGPRPRSRTPGPATMRHFLGGLGDVLRLGALLALTHLVGDLLSLLEVSEPAALYSGEVHQEVLAPLVGGYEAVALLLVEPLHRALGHFWDPPFSAGFSGRGEPSFD
jgi:hypothetical protein